MKNIFLKSLQIQNFKGIENLTIDFNQDGPTSIYGANGTGKTTVFDAFTWLLFGKESTDRKDFNVKNTVKTELNRMEHIVQCEIVIDGKTIKLKRVFKENWVKKRGSEVSEFSGNTTDFYFNTVPLSQGEYQKRIAEILPEDVFKMISNPSYFCVTMDWKKRRDMLVQISGEINDQDIINSNQNYKDLVAKLAEHRSIEDYKKSVKNSVLESKRKLDEIPTRIDQQLKSTPEAIDFLEIENKVKTERERLKEVEDKILDVNKAHETQLEKIRSRKTRINNLLIELNKIETEAAEEAKSRNKVDNSLLSELENNKKTLYANLGSLNGDIDFIKDQITKKKSLIDSKQIELNNTRSEWVKKNETVFYFDESQCICPTCKRQLEQSNIEQQKESLQANFNQSKVDALELLRKQGVDLSSEIQKLQSEISELESKLTPLENQIKSKESEIEKVKEQIDLETAKIKESQANEVDLEAVKYSILSFNEDYQNKLLEVQSLQEIQDESIPSNEELKTLRESIQTTIKELEQKLSVKSQIEQSKQIIEKLKEDEKTYAQIVANAEKDLFLVESFEREKMQAIENKVNQMFGFVTFKLFETQINGGTKDICEAQVKGVPYSDANNAGKINAGLDIINTLCKNLNITVPVFIDNAESTHSIIETNSQLIKLIVSEESKTLTVK